MNYSKDDVQNAMRFFFRVWHEGSISETDKEVGYLYQTPSIRSILEDVIEQEANVKFISYNNQVYMVPQLQSSLFSYSHAELREKMKLKREKDLYLSYFVMLNLLSCFYNSQDQSLTTRSFVTTNALYKTIEKRMEQIKNKSEEVLMEASNEYELDFLGMIDAWYELRSTHDQLKNYDRSQNNKVGFVYHVLHFLEDEGLIMIVDKQEIVLKEKLKHIVFRYYFNSKRKDELLSIFETTLFKEELHRAAN